MSPFFKEGSAKAARADSWSAKSLARWAGSAIARIAELRCGKTAKVRARRTSSTAPSTGSLEILARCSLASATGGRPLDVTLVVESYHTHKQWEANTDEWIVANNEVLGQGHGVEPGRQRERVPIKRQYDGESIVREVKTGHAAVHVVLDEHHPLSPGYERTCCSTDRTCPPDEIQYSSTPTRRAERVAQTRSAAAQARRDDGKRKTAAGACKGRHPTTAP